MQHLADQVQSLGSQVANLDAREDGGDSENAPVVGDEPTTTADGDEEKTGSTDDATIPDGSGDFADVSSSPTPADTDAEPPFDDSEEPDEPVVDNDDNNDGGSADVGFVDEGTAKSLRQRRLGAKSRRLADLLRKMQRLRQVQQNVRVHREHRWPLAL